MEIGRWQEAETASSARGAASRAREAAARGEAADRRAWLVQTIESEIIPRIIRAHEVRSAVVPALAQAPEKPDSASVSRLAEILVKGDICAASAHVEEVRDRGTSLETVYLDLLAAAARRLGEMWTDDVFTFAEVTIGLGRLQQMLRALSPDFVGQSDAAVHGKSALLAGAPGEQHVFGLLMVAEFMRRSGWSVRCELTASVDDLAEIVRKGEICLVGFSLSCAERVDALTAAIGQTRRAASGHAVAVMVGGQVFVERPELASLVGADQTAADGRAAAHQAAKLVIRP
ncbi:MAG: cobalamin B12-binding domain-containing protein [Alphaproteobacteria bacterium]|nr:cobalamin B12-binding domain-containing protein [Alphaproteobacteria bacterium]